MIHLRLLCEKKVKTPHALTALTHEYTEEENEYFIEVRKCILTKGNTVGLKGSVFAHSLVLLW